MTLHEHCLRNVAGALRDIARLDAFNGTLEDWALDLAAAYVELGRQHFDAPALHIGVGLDSSLLKFRGDQMLPPGDPTDPAVSQEIHGGYLTPSKTGRRLIPNGVIAGVSDPRGVAPSKSTSKGETV